MEKSISMLGNAYLSQDYWAEATNIACYAVNRSFTSALVDKTPYEAWDGKRTSLSHLIVFGCDSFMQIPKKENRSLTVSQISVSSLDTRIE